MRDSLSHKVLHTFGAFQIQNIQKFTCMPLSYILKQISSIALYLSHTDILSMKKKVVYSAGKLIPFLIKFSNLSFSLCRQWEVAFISNLNAPASRSSFKTFYIAYIDYSSLHIKIHNNCHLILIISALERQLFNV